MKLRRTTATLTEVVSRTLIPVVSGFSRTLIVVCTLWPTYAHAQAKDAFVEGLTQLMNAVDGTFGDEGPALRAAVEAMSRGLAAWDARVDRWIAQLSPIDGAALMERPEWVIHGVLREGLEADRARRVCRDSTAANGLACYHARLRSYTTLPLTSDEVTRIAAGLRRSLDDERRTKLGGR